MMLQCGIWFLC